MVHCSIYRLHFENLFAHVKVYPNVFDSWYTEKFSEILPLTTHVE